MSTDKPRSPFAAAADGFDRLALAVKDKELARTGAKRAVPDFPPALHPEEAWARSYATHVISPKQEKGRLPLSGFVAPPAEMPKMPDLPAGPQHMMQSGQVEADAGTHIGAGLGKPAPRRSLLGRLFRGPARGV
jgi:hypothetical protein